MDLVVHTLDSLLPGRRALEEPAYAEVYRELLGVEEFSVSRAREDWETDGMVLLQMWRERRGSDPEKEDVRRFENAVFCAVSRRLDESPSREERPAGMVPFGAGGAVALACNGWQQAATALLAQVGVNWEDMPAAFAEDGVLWEDILRVLARRARRRYGAEPQRVSVIGADANLRRACARLGWECADEG